MGKKAPLDFLLLRSGMSEENCDVVRRAFKETRGAVRYGKMERALEVTLAFASEDKRTLVSHMKAQLAEDSACYKDDTNANEAVRAARCAAAERREQEREEMREEKRRRIIEAMPPPAESTRTAVLPPAAVEFPASGRASAKRRAPQPRTPRR